MVLKHRGLEILANAVVAGPGGIVQHGLRLIVPARVGLRKAKRFDAAEPVEEIGEADINLLDGQV